jgi:hypothetical protein
VCGNEVFKALWGAKHLGSVLLQHLASRSFGWLKRFLSGSMLVIESLVRLNKDSEIHVLYFEKLSRKLSIRQKR